MRRDIPELAGLHVRAQSPEPGTRTACLKPTPLTTVLAQGASLSSWARPPRLQAWNAALASSNRPESTPSLISSCLLGDPSAPPEPPAHRTLAQHLQLSFSRALCIPDPCHHT